MPVRSDQLIQSVISGAVTNQVVYTAAANHVVIVKDLCVSNRSANVKTVSIDVGPGGNSTDIFVETIAANTMVRVERWVVLIAGNQLRVTTTAAGNLGVLASGAELVV